MNKNHRVIYTVPLEYADIAESFLIASLPTGFEEKVLPYGDVSFIIYAEKPEHDTEWHKEITELLIEKCQATVEYTIEDIVPWIEQWKASCTPVHAGQFYIIPEWYDTPIPEDYIPILITPRMAFGTGHHATTALCLHAFSSSYLPQGDFLDIGTGSGILSIALALLGLHGDAVDIDGIAIDNAKENALLNNVANNITFYTGDVYSIGKEKKYTLIIANILADVIYTLTETIRDKLVHNGICILSGILTIQMQKIIEHYISYGFELCYRQDSDEWAMCILRYTASS